MSNDSNAAALAVALAPLIARELANNPTLLKDAIRPAVEEQIDPLRRKNAELLDKVARKAERRTHDRNGQPFDASYSQEDEDRHLAWEAEQAKREQQSKKPDAKDPTRQLASGDLYISRADARNPQQYLAAKARAEAEGRRLVIGSPAEYADSAWRHDQPAAAQRSRLTTLDDPISKTRFIRADLDTQSGSVGRRMEAERVGLRLKRFDTLHDLPEHLRPQAEKMERDLG